LSTSLDQVGRCVAARTGVRAVFAALVLLSSGTGGCGQPRRPARDGLQTAIAPAPVDAASLLAVIESLPPGRAIGTEAHAATRRLIETRLAELGWTVERRPFSWAGAPDAELVNLELRVPGNSSTAPLLVICAHYDSVARTPGADDNGSGTAALLELARRLAGRRFPHELRLVWFDAEEPGLIGSGAWVAALSQADRERLIGAINLETLGYTDRAAGSQHFPAGVRALFDPGDRGDFLLVVGNVASWSLASAVERGMAGEQGAHFRAVMFSALPGAGWLVPDSRRSDHARFWDAGLRAVMLTDTANLRSPHYHRSSDTVDTLDLPFLAAAVRGVERAIEILAHPPDEVRATGG
jgi:hypothetical protein